MIPQLKSRAGMMVLALLAGLMAGRVDSAGAADGKPCAELEAEIAAKLAAKGIRNYELVTVDTGKAGPGATVVGTCERGSKQITYEKK